MLLKAERRFTTTVSTQTEADVKDLNSSVRGRIDAAELVGAPDCQ
jgi:hypothetical protein